MAISLVGYASAATTSVTLPAGYQAGDVALPHAFRSTAATIPTLGTDAVSIGSNAANTCAFAWGFRVLRASTSLTSGTFTGATQLQYPVYRGVKGWAARSSNNGASTSMNYAAVTAGAATGRSWWCAAGAHRTANNVNGAISGLTLRGNVGTGPMAALFDSNGTKSGNWTSTSLTVSASSGWNTEIGELTDYSTWLNYDSSWSVSADGNTFTFNGTGDHAGCTSYPRNDKRTFGITIVKLTGDCAIGLFDSVAGTGAGSLSGELGGTVHACGQFPGSRYQTNNTHVTTTGVTWATGDYVLVAMDGPNRLIWYKNVTTGGYWNNDPSADPDTGAGGLSFSTMTAGYFWPAFGSFIATDACTFDGNPTTSLTTFPGWDDDGGASFTAAIAESGSAVASQDATTSVASARTESGSAVEAITALLGALASVAEAGSAAETPAAILATAASASESGSAADSPSAGANTTASASEAGSATDAPSAGLAALATISEAGTALDALSALLALASSRAETGSASDTSSGLTAVASATAEAGSATEALSAVAQMLAAMSESGAASDASTATGAFVAAQTETGSAADLSNTGAQISASMAETGSASDGSTATAALVVSITETAALAEAVTALLSASAARSDALAASDASAAYGAFFSALSDAMAAADSSASVTVLGAAVSEAGAASEASSLVASFNAAIAEGGSLADLISAVIVHPANPSPGRIICVVGANRITSVDGAVRFVNVPAACRVVIAEE